MFSGSFDSSDGVWQVGPEGTWPAGCRRLAPAALQDSQAGPAPGSALFSQAQEARQGGQGRAGPEGPSARQAQPGHRHGG